MTDTDEDFVMVSDRNMLSRFLFPNPVVLLTTYVPDKNIRNVMTLTWLTPINNQGTFVASVNAKRYTAEMLESCSYFVLNVPIAGQERMVVAIGSCSGRDGDKFDRLSIETCLPGWRAAPDSIPNPQSSLNPNSKAAKAQALNTAIDTQTIAIKDSIAHVVCKQRSSQEIDGHILFTCDIVRVYVKTSYWTGTTFVAQSITRKRLKLTPENVDQNELNNASEEEKSLADGTDMDQSNNNGTNRSDNDRQHDDKHDQQPPPPYLTFLGSKTFGYVTYGLALPMNDQSGI